MRVWGGSVLMILLVLFPSVVSATDGERPFVDLHGFDGLKTSPGCKGAVSDTLKALRYQVREPGVVTNVQSLRPSDQRRIHLNEANAGLRQFRVSPTTSEGGEWRFVFVSGDAPSISSDVFTDTQGCREVLQKMNLPEATPAQIAAERAARPPAEVKSAPPANPSAPPRQNATPTRAIQAESLSSTPASASRAPVNSEWSKWHFAIDLGYRRTEQSEDGNYYNADLSTDEYYQSWVVGESLALSFGASRLISADLSWFVAGGMLFTNWIDAEENSLKIQTDETGLMLRGGAEYQVFRSVRVEAAVELMPLPDLTRGSFSLGATFNPTPHLGLGARVGIQSEGGSGADDDYDYNWDATGGTIDGFLRFTF
jgi:hypothetical protein